MTKVKNDYANRNFVRAGLWCLAFCGASLSQAAGFPYSQNANITTFGPTPVTASNISNFTSQMTGNPGAPLYKASAMIPTHGGAMVPVNLSATLNKPSMARALGSFIGKVAFPINVGTAAYDLLKDLEVIPSWDGSKNTLGKLPTGSHQGNGLEYQPDSISGVAPFTWYPDQQMACITWMGAATSLDGKGRTGYVNGNSCRVTIVENGQTNDIAVLSRTSSSCLSGWWISAAGCSQNPVLTPMTQQELTDLIATRSGWPTSARLLETLNQAIKAGEQVMTDDPTVTGPGSKTTSSNSVDSTGKTVVTNNTTNYTYNNNTVTQTTTSTTTTNNVDGTTVTGTTTTSTPETPDPTDPCKANPDRAGCADLDTPEQEIPRGQRTLTFEEVSLFGGGSCPADSTLTLHTGKVITVTPWAKYCTYIAGPIKAVLLAAAAFGALLILADGFKS